jgi:N4-gp56 family major capsid protein
MADTVAATGLTVQQWDDKYIDEYFQGLQAFRPLMGTGENDVIQTREDLTKEPGDSITFALVNRLTNAATTGTTVLEGFEEDLVSRSMRVYVDKRRNAVRVPEMSEQRSAIGLRAAAKPTLLNWSVEDTRDLIITALGSLNGTAFLSRTTAIADAWLVDNVDRVQFGAVAAPSATDLSSALGDLDTTSDLFTAAVLDAAILKAKTCSPKIRPMRDGGNGKRYYVAFANPHAFKNFRDSIDTEVLALTAVEMQASKLFEGGDLLWNGVIIKEVDNIPIYLNIGNSSAEVTPVYLCGAQALAVAYAKHWGTVTEKFDYGDKHGVAVEAIYGVRKLIFGTGSADTDDTKDNGVVTIFVATTGAATHSGSAAEL